MENEVIQAVVLGIIQGITEFLPISSSAHLVLTPWIFGWEDPGLSFDVALHVGTLIAVVGYFWKEWVQIFSKLFSSKQNGSVEDNETLPQNMFWMIVVATIPGVLAGYFFNKQAETLFRDPLLIAAMLAFFGVILWLVDRKSGQGRALQDIRFKDCLVIGFLQAFAIIPGVSRSGITITAGLQQGLKRKDAAKFSFLLSTPIIFGAAVYQARDLFASNFGAAQLIGVLASAISGYIAIFWLVKFVERFSYSIFFWYRLLIAAVIVGTAIFVK